MYRYLKICVVLVSLLIQTAAAQNAPTEVNLVHPNHRELERATFLSVNSLRKEKGEPDLIWNDILYRAAKDHADYLIGEKKISHLQTVRGKQTPGQRVKLHGGVSFTTTGENIVEVTLGVQSLSAGKIRSSFTYPAAGAYMADLWKHSPGHYKNIISKSFNGAALATAYDSATRRLVAVQVFGYSPMPEIQNSISDYATSVITSPPPRLPYGLKEYRQKAKHQKAINAFVRMKVDRGYLTGPYKSAKKIFKGGRSGIVQEFIPLQQFDSASADFLSVPNRGIGQYQLNLMEHLFLMIFLRFERIQNNT